MSTRRGSGGGKGRGIRPSSLSCAGRAPRPVKTESSFGGQRVRRAAADDREHRRGAQCPRRRRRRTLHPDAIAFSGRNSRSMPDR